MDLQVLSRLAAYLAFILVLAALAIFLFLFLNLRADELLANMIYWSLGAAFFCFAFWAVSATYIEFSKPKK
jgi:hypothetical protein